MSKGSPDRVELVNLPHYAQGSHDGLCTYYSSAMLLATLFPEFAGTFGVGERRRRAGLVVEDPLIRYFPRDGVNTSNDKALASWFYGGEYVKTAGRILNKTMRKHGHRTRFIFEPETRHDNTFEEIAASIDHGLPVIIGWNTEDFGDHTVVVRGYERGQFKWFLLRDPGGEERIAWESLKKTMTSRLAVLRVNPNKHDGLRPDKLSTTDGTSKLERWWHKDGKLDYFDVAELYLAAKHSKQFEENDAIEDDDD